MRSAAWPRFGRWFGTRFVLFLAIVPALILLVPRVHEAAWAVFGLGAAIRLAPRLERPAIGLRRRLLTTLPGLLGIVLVLAGWSIGRERLGGWLEARRPPPAAGAPNVLLITIDTARADHLSLYGYGRPTSPVLSELPRSNPYDPNHRRSPAHRGPRPQPGRGDAAGPGAAPAPAR